MGLPNSPMANAAIRVASGNFVTARPIGVIEGIDLMHTGEVRKVDTRGYPFAAGTRGVDIAFAAGLFAYRRDF